MAVDHYENFPVASIFLPRRLRVPVRNIYRYARSADDIADEGDATTDERLAQLAQYRLALHQIGHGTLQLADNDPLRRIFEPLAASIDQFELPLAPFFALLSAFEQDVTQGRYADDAALFDYCSRSANPVGHLMLHLYNAVTPPNIDDANAICTGLQLTNFWQDIALDSQKRRIYLPQDKLRRYHIVEEAIERRQTDDAWRALMREQTQQARQLLISGLPLVYRLPPRLSFELRLVIQGGLRILERLDQLHYDVFLNRPTLRKRDWILLLWRALR